MKSFFKVGGEAHIRLLQEDAARQNVVPEYEPSTGMKTAVFIFFIAIIALVSFLFINATDAQVCINLVSERAKCTGDVSDHCERVRTSFDLARRSGDCQ